MGEVSRGLSTALLLLLLFPLCGGAKLKGRPATFTTWKKWRKQHPDSAGPSPDTGYQRDHSRDPHENYYELPPKPRTGLRIGNARLVTGQVQPGHLLRLGIAQGFRVFQDESPQIDCRRRLPAGTGAIVAATAGNLVLRLCRNPDAARRA